MTPIIKEVRSSRIMIHLPFVSGEPDHLAA